MNSSILALFVIALLIIGLLAYGVYLAWGSSQHQTSRKMKKRINALAVERQDGAGKTSILKNNLMNDATWLSHLLKSLPSGRSLEFRLHQSGLSWSVAKFGVITLLALVLGVVAALVAPLPLPAKLGLPLLCALVPHLLVNFKRKRRLKQFDKQLPEALDLIARSLQTGLAFMAALTMVAEEFPAPLGEDFRMLNAEINYGASLNDAFNNMVARSPSEDLRYFVIAMLVQRETGGNLAELTGNIAQLIRDRLALRDKIQTLTAEGRLSATILTLMPFLLVGLLGVMNREYVRVLWTDQTGIKISYCMFGMIAIGNMVMRKMVAIKI